MPRDRGMTLRLVCQLAALLLLVAQSAPLSASCRCDMPVAPETSAHGCCAAMPGMDGGTNGPPVEGSATLHDPCCEHHQLPRFAPAATFADTKDVRQARSAVPMGSRPLGDQEPRPEAAPDATSPPSPSARAPVYLMTLRLRN